MVLNPLRNLGLKIVSVFLAILLWLVVAGQPVERSLRVPLEVRNLSASLHVAELPVTTLEVRVRGASSVLSELDAGDIVAYVDLSGLGVGRHDLSVRVDRASGFGVVTAEPSVVQIVVE